MLPFIHNLVPVSKIISTALIQLLGINYYFIKIQIYKNQMNWNEMSDSEEDSWFDDDPPKAEGETTEQTQTKPKQ